MSGLYISDYEEAGEKKKTVSSQFQVELEGEIVSLFRSIAIRFPQFIFVNWVFFSDEMRFNNSEFECENSDIGGENSLYILALLMQI